MYLVIPNRVNPVSPLEFIKGFSLLQYLAACIVSGVASTSIGTVLGFSAILLPQLDDEGLVDSKSQEASWIGKKLSTLLF